jgi:hypothetical protein
MMIKIHDVAANVAGVRKIYAFGANSIIPWLAQAGHVIPLSNLEPSRDVDVTTGDAKLDILIDGAIGELSPFDKTFAVYAHSVDFALFQAPVNWQQRTAKRTEPMSGVEIIVPHPHDLIISKLAAGRPKDFEFAVAVSSLFPITDYVLNNLIDEFRAVHPQAEAALRANVEIWQNKILRVENKQG